MKHKLLSLSIGTAVVLSVAPTFAGGANSGHNSSIPQVYGRLDVAQSRQDDDGSDAFWDVISYASRLGFKGEVNTNTEATVIYKYEVELNPTEDEINSSDDSNSDDSNFLKARNQYVGLKTNYGTIRLGRMDTPLKTSQGKVDIFGDHAADIKVFLEGENREGDTFNYESPSFNGVKVQLALIAGENNDSGNFDAGSDGIADGTSVSLTYKGDNYYVGVARDLEVDAHDLTRVTGTVKLGDFGLGALYQTGEKVDDTEKHDGYVLSGYYKAGATKLKLQYGASENELTAGGATTEHDLLGLGVDYSLAKPTTIYGEYIILSEDDGSTDTDEKTFAVGIRHKF